MRYRSEQTPIAAGQGNRNELSPRINVPDLGRKYALMYVIVSLARTRADGVSRGEIQRLAEALKVEQPVSLYKICDTAGLVNNSDRYLAHDPLLTRVILDYEPEEMCHESIDPVPPVGPYDLPTTVADIEAGDGAARPLLKELYSLEALGVLKIVGFGTNESFVATNRGSELVEAISVVFDYLDWKGHKNLRLVIGRAGGQLLPEGILLPHSVVA